MLHPHGALSDVDRLNPGNICLESDLKGTQHVFVLFLDQILRHCSKRTALIIPFISLCEHTVVGKLKQSHEGQNSASVHPGDCLISLTHIHTVTHSQPKRKNSR